MKEFNNMLFVVFMLFCLVMAILTYQALPLRAAFIGGAIATAIYWALIKVEEFEIEEKESLDNHERNP